MPITFGGNAKDAQVILRGLPVPSRLGQYRRGLFITRPFTEMFLEALP